MLNRLEKGDEIEIVAPASYIEDKEKFNLGIEILEKWGLRINKNFNLKAKNLLQESPKAFSNRFLIKVLLESEENAPGEPQNIF